MIDLARIWTGCKCANGETWQVVIINSIDTEMDRVEKQAVCRICHSSNIKPKKSENGLDCYYQMTEEEMQWELYEAGEWEDEDPP